MKFSRRPIFLLYALFGTIKTASVELAKSPDTSDNQHLNVETRISYGQPEREVNSFIVALHDDSHVQGMCGGSIISSRLVLTATHCLIGTRFNHVRILTLDGRNEISHPIRDFIIYPSHYNGAAKIVGKDISLILLVAPISNGRIIPLAPKNFIVPPGATVTALGWGKTEYGVQSHNLRSTQLQVIQCLPPIYGNSHICTASFMNGVCKGDSGGPLVYKNHLVGIVSFGELDCGAGGLTVYTAVSAYRDWIDRYIAMYP